MKIWITAWAFQEYAAPRGVIVIDVPEDELRFRDGQDSGILIVPKAALAPWVPPFRVVDLLPGNWHRSEEEALAAVRRKLEKDRATFKRELARTEERLTKLKKKGLPMADTLRGANEKRKAKRAARISGESGLVQ